MCSNINDGYSYINLPITAKISISILNECSEAMKKITGNSSDGSITAEDISNPRADFIVLFKDYSYIGCGAIREISQDTAEIANIYSRITGEGAGYTLISILEARARFLGYNTLIAATKRVNSNAIHFFKKHDYKICRKYGKYQGKTDYSCFKKRISLDDSFIWKPPTKPEPHYLNMDVLIKQTSDKEELKNKPKYY